MLTFDFSWKIYTNFSKCYTVPNGENCPISNSGFAKIKQQVILTCDPSCFTQHTLANKQASMKYNLPKCIAHYKNTAATANTMEEIHFCSQSPVTAVLPNWQIKWPSYVKDLDIKLPQWILILAIKHECVHCTKKARDKMDVKVKTTNCLLPSLRKTVNAFFFQLSRINCQSSQWNKSDGKLVLTSLRVHSIAFFLFPWALKWR